MGCAEREARRASVHAWRLAVSLLAGGLGGLVATVPAAAVEVLTPLELPDGFQYPNGITQTEAGALLVGSVVSGRIYRLDDEGATPFEQPDPSVFAGTTLRYDAAADRLWGASPDFLGVEQPDGTIMRRAHRIFARDTATGAVDFAMLIPDDGFGNDIALADDGTLFVTDTSVPRVLRLDPGSNRLETYVADRRLSSPGSGVDGIGAAGIAIAEDGHTLLVGLYGAGQLFALRRTEIGGVRLDEIELERELENPDGFAIADDGSLLLVEGGVASGNGRLTRIPDPLAEGVRPVETLVEGLDIPVNLLIDRNDPKLVYVTESGLGHRFTESRRSPEPPSTFYVRRYRLD